MASGSIQVVESVAGTIQRATLPNGLVLLGSERPRLSTVAVRLRVYAGAAHDADETEGLARLVGVLLRHGTSRYRYEELSSLTDGLGASVGEDIHRGYTDLVVRCLAEDFATLADLLFELVRSPIFPDLEFARLRGSAESAILRADQDTRVVAEREFRAAAYPPGHPYRRSLLGTRGAIAALSREDLVAFHARHYRPDAMAVAVVGGVPFAEAVAVIERTCAGWRAPSAPPSPLEALASPPAAARSRQYFALPGKAQADIVLGLVARGREDPAYYALDMANLILGRLGLYGRLGRAVREERGLAYYAFSTLDGGRGPVPWMARAGVDPANVERAIETIVEEVARFGRDGVTDAELADAKSFLVGSLALGVEGSGGLALALLNIEFHALGLDFLTRYPAIVSALTREAVREAAWSYLRPEGLTIAVAGPPRQ